VEISLHALTGVTTADTMLLDTTVKSASLRALVDCGSTHSFIAYDTARCLGLTPGSRPRLTMGVANGDHVPLDGVCSSVEVTAGGEGFSMDLFDLPLADYELVLGWAVTGSSLWAPSCGISIARLWLSGTRTTALSGLASA
jgi:hypothetical protein